MPKRVLPPTGPAARWPLHGIAATRLLENRLAQTASGTSLMQRAGLAVARSVMALAPHASSVWVACGSGNNGGDGLEAAIHLKRWGKTPWVSWLGHPDQCPADALAAFRRATAEGVDIHTEAPPEFDFCVDALVGIGRAERTPEPRIDPTPDESERAKAKPRKVGSKLALWIAHINASQNPVLAVDLPSGLNGDTGQIDTACIRARYTLSLLTLKPGQFTASGLDVCGDIWLDDLCPPGFGAPLDSHRSAVAPTAWLTGVPVASRRLHASHKGSYGDVAIVGGAEGMVGAALLAGRSALRAGAGRAYVGLLAADSLAADPNCPELMMRGVEQLDFGSFTVMMGCGGGGGGGHFSTHIARALSHAKRLVLDADGLNAIAADSQLQTLLMSRSKRVLATVLTPHPLEAARLLGLTSLQIQNDRLRHAQDLAQRFQCVVVLKGSGTVVAAPGLSPWINPTGNAGLATAGTGDVLAGMMGTALAQLAEAASLQAVQATCAGTVYWHGQLADSWPTGSHLTASDLIAQL